MHPYHQCGAVPSQGAVPHSLNPKFDLTCTFLVVELRVVEGQPSFSFVCASFSMATSEAERVGINQVTKILPAGGASGATHCTPPPTDSLLHALQIGLAWHASTSLQLAVLARPFSPLAHAVAAQLTSVQTSAQMLVDRAAGLASILAAMQSGDVPLDPQVVRRVAALTARLPVAEDAQFAGDSATEGCDALMSVLLAGLTRASATGEFIKLVTTLVPFLHGRECHLMRLPLAHCCSSPALAAMGAYYFGCG